MFLREKEIVYETEVRNIEGSSEDIINNNLYVCRRVLVWEIQEKLEGNDLSLMTRTGEAVGDKIKDVQLNMENPTGVTGNIVGNTIGTIPSTQQSAALSVIDQIIK